MNIWYQRDGDRDRDGEGKGEGEGDRDGERYRERYKYRDKYRYKYRTRYSTHTQQHILNTSDYNKYKYGNYLDIGIRNKNAIAYDIIQLKYNKTHQTNAN